MLLPEHTEEAAAAAVPPTEVGETVAVTSLEKVAEPQVGVDVQTTYHVPAPPISVAVGV